MREYVCSLETAMVQTCSELGVKAHTTDNIGVWVGDEKLCSLGKNHR